MNEERQHHYWKDNFSHFSNVPDYSIVKHSTLVLFAVIASSQLAQFELGFDSDRTDILQA